MLLKSLSFGGNSCSFSAISLELTYLFNFTSAGLVAPERLGICVFFEIIDVLVIKDSYLIDL